MIWLKLLLISSFVFAVEGPTGSVALKTPPMPKHPDDCKYCHMDKKSEFVSKKNHTQMEHVQIKSQHGEKILACNYCHDRDNHNFLKSKAPFIASFANPSPVCQQCHEEVFRNWKLGIHGKRVGGWKGDDREQFNCIECHDPHFVKFKSMKALPAPERPKLGIPKSSDPE